MEDFNLDYDFIRRAEKVTSFNLSERDFNSPKYQREIRFLYIKNFFPGFDDKLFTDQVDAASINRGIDALKRQDLAKFQNLFKFTPGGLGPGEVMLFFLIDNAQLGGAGSAGVDVIVGSERYEVKAAVISKNSVASGFKLGGTVGLSQLMIDLNSLRERLKLGGSRTEIPGSVIKEMSLKDPDTFAELKGRFRQISYNSYFKNHKIIIINNTPSTNFGRIEAIKQVQFADIDIERVTSGTIKPLVQL